METSLPVRISADALVLQRSHGAEVLQSSRRELASSVGMPFAVANPAPLAAPGNRLAPSEHPPRSDALIDR